MSPSSDTTSRLPHVSVIVPLHRDTARFRIALDHLLGVATAIPYEVIVVSDAPVDLPTGVVGVVTGAPADTSPAVKRDLATGFARAPILAFIDDDAYPTPSWIDDGVAALSDESIVAVGGPGVTPPGSPWRERLGGALYETWLGSGPLQHRFRPKPPARDADDLPAFNLFIRRAALVEVGGWASTFYGGEDTKLCLELRRAGFRLRYVPTVVVNHYRRRVLLPHLRQIGNVGRHRGSFVRRFPDTSRKPVYLLPAFLTVSLAVIMVTAVWHPTTLLVAGAAWALLGVSQARALGPSALLYPAALVAHHVTYGVQFLRGLLGKPIQR